MSFRIEEKISIDNKQLVDFKIFLSDRNVKKIHQPRKIQSLYFDNSNYEMYTDSIEGLTPRKKIRVRNYPASEDSKFYLETKISSVEGRFKTRKIIEKNYFNNLKKVGILDPQYGLCKPCLYVIYNREYYIENWNEKKKRNNQFSTIIKLVSSDRTRDINIGEFEFNTIYNNEINFRFYKKFIESIENV